MVLTSKWFMVNGNSVYGVVELLMGSQTQQSNILYSHTFWLPIPPIPQITNIYPLIVNHFNLVSFHTL